ncbi:molybdenum cofactor biosynthesis protein B [Hahella ganghwensis]|uniref:molybdenum cofactor biosynthesis protein B n=1 Tax=Hahella ganghwensis TaxID=286420 RepID=UPI000376CC26|nr:molybdenum cofactor biosynthesis protein B [Hahella ganghwensis]
MAQHKATDFIPLNIAVLTVSDTRTSENDTSGQALVDGAESVGHKVVDRQLIPDDVYIMRAVVSAWIADAAVQVVLVTGGTGFTSRDSTPEALIPLLDKQIEGFGELFRAISHEEIGTSTVQSRAFAGLANATLIFAMPGSTGACRTAWNKIICEQLDARHRPCNFVGILSVGRDDGTSQVAGSVVASVKTDCGPRP